MVKVDLSEATVELLKDFAEPLVDTFDTVIKKLADSYTASLGVVPAKVGQPIGFEGNVMVFASDNLPNLAFTTLTQATVEGNVLPRSENYWNKLMNRVILFIGKSGGPPDDLYKLLSVNAVIGEKTDSGYTYLPEVGISVQGQDSNGAFRQTVELATSRAVRLKVYFYWQDNPNAAFPGQLGMVEVR